MPIYEYSCQKCQHEFEIFANMDDSDARRTCPMCGQRAVERKMSVFAAQQAPAELPPPACGASHCCGGGHCGHRGH